MYPAVCFVREEPFKHGKQKLIKAIFHFSLKLKRKEAHTTISCYVVMPHPKAANKLRFLWCCLDMHWSNAGTFFLLSVKIMIDVYRPSTPHNIHVEWSVFLLLFSSAVSCAVLWTWLQSLPLSFNLSKYQRLYMLGLHLSHCLPYSTYCVWRMLPVFDDSWIQLDLSVIHLPKLLIFWGCFRHFLWRVEIRVQSWLS